MKFRMISYASIILSLFCQATFAENNPVTYKNDRGSILQLAFNPDGTLSGYFVTAVASRECQKAIGMKRPVTGYLAKDTLAFSVSYPECGVVTFIGNIGDGRKSIDTTALVAHTSSLSGKGADMRWITHDIFRQING